MRIPEIGKEKDFGILSLIFTEKDGCKPPMVAGSVA